MKEDKNYSEKFQIIFQEVDLFKTKNPDYDFNFISESMNQASDEIRNFGEICNEISDSKSHQFCLTTFS